MDIDKLTKSLSEELRGLLMNQEFFASLEDVNKFLIDNEVSDSTVIQTLIFDKKVFKTQAEATEWASDHGFRIDKVDDTEGSFRIRQRSPEEFIEDSFRTIDIRRGVKAVIGKLREIEGQEFTLSLKNDILIKNIESNNINLHEGLPHIIELAKVVHGYHQNYGEINITKEILESFERNFNDKVYGVDISIDFDHETREAAGWLNSVYLSYDKDKLLGEVKWTPKGALALKDKEFRYFSPEFNLNYVHPHTGKEYGATLLGGALVNRPFLKMDAIVSLKHKDNGGVKMDTIAMSEHNAKVSGLEKDIANFKLSESKMQDEVKKLKEDNKKLSDENTSLKDEMEKKEKQAIFEKLFKDEKINKAQYDALIEGKGLVDVLSLSEKMNTNPKGNGGAGEIKLSEEEMDMCKRLDLTPEDFVKANEIK